MHKTEFHSFVPFGLSIGLVTLMVLGSGCSTTTNVLNKSAQRPYDFEAQILHPQCSVLPAGIDSVDVYLEWNRKECLYLRESPKAPFTANLSIQAGTFEVNWSDTLSDYAPKWSRIHWRSSLAEFAADWNQGTNLIEVELSDLNRKTSVQWSVPLPQPGKPRTPFHSDGWPVYDQFAHVGDTVYFMSEANMTWQHASVEVPHALPSPPFTQTQDKSDTLQPILRSEWISDDTGWSGYIVQPGLNVVGQPTNDGSIRVAHRLQGAKAEHPYVRDLSDMIMASRYITSRSEYEQMTDADDAKAALDEFWLNCSSDPSQASALIATYYGRVEEANRYFSGIYPGWRTDRGMVHIVFGVPDKVRKSKDSEWWVYGEEGSANAITFRFLHVEHPWDEDFYVLSRSIQFRSPWDRMVTNWRNGRIKID